MGLLLARKKIDKKYYKVEFYQNDVYDRIKGYEENSIRFDPNTKLERDEWYYIDCFSSTNYFLPIMGESFSSAELDQLKEVKNIDIDAILEKRQNLLLFQKITPSKVVYSKKFFKVVKDGCDIKEVSDSIDINVVPSAIYNQNSDKLYFRKFSDISIIFDGIIDLYREATDDEVNNFFGLKFINTVDFDICDVKTENRKQILMVQRDMEDWSKSEQNSVIGYIRAYATDLRYENNRFLIHDEKELRLLLWGLEQRFFTTIVGERKYIANSVRNI